ncbi:hypothetical protein, partial [Deinococcus sp.]|uniref:hypothetical protein n=1 Tax=Deinococcus sp. TaxID=47478 RepID=UPI00286EA6EC
ARHLDMFLALQPEQVADLERFAAVADVEHAVFGDRALVDVEELTPAASATSVILTFIPAS